MEDDRPSHRFTAFFEMTGALPVAIAAMPELPEREARELRVRSAFCRSMWTTRGFGAPEVLNMATCPFYLGSLALCA